MNISTTLFQGTIITNSTIADIKLISSQRRSIALLMMYTMIKCLKDYPGDGSKARL